MVGAILKKGVPYLKKGGGAVDVLSDDMGAGLEDSTCSRSFS